MLSGNNTLV